MKTSTYKRIVWAAGLASIAAMSGCGPEYTEDRWYARDYYAQHPQQAAPQPQQTYAQPQQGYSQPQYVGTPVAQQIVEQAPMVQADPQFADLTTYGQWEMTEEYGRIWVPYANRTPGWRPYFYGQWEYTDWGWSWVSDESWGAGPYHYGRWTWLNGRNWVWVPDYTWGPAWVTWSHGGGCVGWAPMGPGGATWGDIHQHSTYWTYVPTGQFGGNKVQHVVVAAADVPRIHSQTVIIDGGSQIRGHGGTAVTYNSGPSRDQVQQWTSRPVDTRPITQVPSVQPRRIPDTATAPAGGTYGSATTPPPTRVGTTPTTPVGTPTVPTRSGVTTPTTPTPPVGTPGRPGSGTTTPPVGTPTRPGATTPTAPVVTPIPPINTAPTRPGVATPVTPTTPINPGPTRPGATTPTTPVVTPIPPINTAPTRPGVATPTTPYTPVTPAPTRPGAGYTGPGPVNVPPQATVPRPTPPPVTNNYAPAPSRYVPPVYTPPTATAPATRPAAPSYTPPTYQAPAYQAPAYQAPTRPSAPSYQAPTYQAPSRPAAPSYQAPAQQQRFSPPPAYSPAPSRPAAAPAPAPQRRR